jgi:hypothetical protein
MGWQRFLPMTSLVSLCFTFMSLAHQIVTVGAASAAVAMPVQPHSLLRREDEAASPASVVGSLNASCVDTAAWTNGHGYDCIGYAQDLCSDGEPKMNMRWALGPEYNYPEKNCCACGKSKVELGSTCVDAADWQNGHGESCKDYAHKWCENGVARPGMSWTLGSVFNHPEINCCVCGKGSNEHAPGNRRPDQWQMLAKVGKDTSIPLVALVIGGILASTAYSSSEVLFGRFVLVIGAQTSINIFVKDVLSEMELPSSALKGAQVPFLVTALQQVFSFVVLGLWAIISQYTPWPYWPKRADTTSAQALIIGLSFSFVFNFALNNLSLCLIDLSLNLIIRACHPLIVLLMEVAISAAAHRWPSEHNWRPRLYIMGIAATFGFLVVLAKVQTHEAMHSSYMAFGSALSLLSLLASCTEHVLIKYAGPTCNLTALDLSFYMSLSTTCLLIPAILFVPHPVNWPHTHSMTEVAIFREVFSLSDVAVALVGVAGFASLVHNTIMYSMIKVLSLEQCSLLQNANKVITICFSVALGFEVLPPEPWTPFFVVGGVITFSAFTYASWLPKVKRTDDKRSMDISWDYTHS